MTQVSFIVPAYNAESTIRKTLDSIAHQKPGVPCEVLIVDDGSNDSTLQIARDWCTEVQSHQSITHTEIIQAVHEGEAAAMNRGMQNAQGELVAWVESDVILAPEWLHFVMDALQEPEIAGAGGWLFPAPSDGWIASFFGYEISRKIGSNVGEVRHITSANSLYRRSVFDQIGPCRVDLGLSSFDSDVNHRIRHAGYRLAFAPAALAWHHYKSTLWQCLKRAWWYGYGRPYVDSQVLYPFDRITGITVLSMIPFVLSLTGLLVGVPGSLGLFTAIILLHLLYALLVFAPFNRFSYVVGFPVFLVRNLIFLAGYGFGVIRRYWP